MDLTIEELEGLRRDLTTGVPLNYRNIDSALAELIRIKTADNEGIHFLAGTTETRESSLQLRISMRLVGVFVNWRNGDASTGRLEVSTRWLVPDRDGTSEMREVKRDFNEYIGDALIEKAVAEWLENPTTVAYPDVVKRVLNRACTEAMWHEIDENFLNVGIRVLDPHKED